MTEHIDFSHAEALLGLPGDDWPGTLLAKQIAVLQHPFESKLLEANMTADQRIFANRLNRAARKGEIEFSKVWNTTSPPELYGDEFTDFLNTLTVEEPAEYRGFKVVLWDRYTNGLPKRWAMPRFRHIEIEGTDFPDLDDDDAIEKAFNEADKLLDSLRPTNTNTTKLEAIGKFTSNWSSQVYFEALPRFSRAEITEWLKLKKFKPSDLLSDWLGKENSPIAQPSEPAYVKPLNPKSLEERLNKLKEFIIFFESVSQAKNIKFDKMDLPLTKQQVLDELNKRYKKNFDIKIDAFKAVWKSATSAGICDNSHPNTKNGKDFLKSIFL